MWDDGQEGKCLVEPGNKAVTVTFPSCIIPALSVLVGQREQSTDSQMMLFPGLESLFLSVMCETEIYLKSLGECTEKVWSHSQWDIKIDIYAKRLCISHINDADCIMSEYSSLTKPDTIQVISFSRKAFPFLFAEWKSQHRAALNILVFYIWPVKSFSWGTVNQLYSFLR